MCSRRALSLCLLLAWSSFTSTAVTGADAERCNIISIVTDAFAWVPGDADWDVGVPEVSERGEVRAARAAHDAIRAKQRIGV